MACVEMRTKEMGENFVRKRAKNVVEGGEVRREDEREGDWLVWILILFLLIYIFKICQNLEGSSICNYSIFFFFF